MINEFCKEIIIHLDLCEKQHTKVKLFFHIHSIAHVNK